MYDNPAGLIAASVILWILASAALSLRFGLKLRERQPLLASDWLILVGWIFGTGLTVLEIYGVAIKSLGYRIGATLLDPTSVTGQLNKAKHIQLAFLLMGITALGFIKLSVCFLYWQLFARKSNNLVLRWFLIVWMIVVTAWATSFVMAGLLECGSHLKALFGQPTEYLQHCGSAVPSGYAMVGTDIATDFITLIIPIPIILRLHMDMQRKLLALSAFLVGALSVGASIAKGYIYIRSSLGLYHEDGLSVSIWNLIEVQVGIVAACGPLFRQVAARVFVIPSFISSRRRSTSKVNDSNKLRDSRGFNHMAESEVELAMRDSNMSQVPSGRSEPGRLHTK